jgi:hypothetical protein
VLICVSKTGYIERKIRKKTPGKTQEKLRKNSDRKIKNLLTNKSALVILIHAF